MAALIGVVFALTGCGSAPADTPDGGTESTAAPEQIVIQRPGLYPEGIEWDVKRQRFLVSSAADGSVTAVHDDGTVNTIDSGDGLTSTLGTVIDEQRDRLLVTVADFAAVDDPNRPGEAKLAIYDLASGRRTHLADLGGLRPGERHLANDVTVDPAGNAYVTDSFTPVIYKVTLDGQPSVVAADPRFGSPKGLGLNGIEYDPRGYLLAAVAGTEKLFRIPLDEPANLTEVRLSEPISIDGITRRSDGNIVVAAPFAPAVISLSSQDDWQSARVVGNAPVAATDSTTNTAIRDGAVYAINAHFAQMHGPKPVQAFEIFRVRT
ncbi:SMP-30/gluconolactonase/LRE family protein [Mycolicibacterium stellerae]|uniref:SMP-30/gluconolactonase/LRE family protein n=1 Tax=Mycolicibacterium stellerae TaxID=2358193 RepID=UPI0013DE6634|nr:SMP-30/gluconolactonase/LRE family protein [Mycolicibacterium stellerae]